MTRFAAELIAPTKARQIIRENAEKAVRNAKAITPVKVDGPITFEVRFKATNQAHMTTTIPLVGQMGPKTIRFTASNMVTGYKLFWACVIIGMSATNGVLGDANA